MTENICNKEKATSQNKKTRIDFVAIDDKRKRICVCNFEDNFTAVNINNIWKKGYPKTDDLLDYYSELKDLDKVKMYSSEARRSLQNLSK